RPVRELFPPSAAVDGTPVPSVAIQPPRVPAARSPQTIAPAPSGALTYETFYGLREKPFSLSSDPKFLYQSASHARVAQDLLRAIRQHDGIVVVTGESGIGKTTMCRGVVEQLDRRTLTSFVVEPFV